MPGAQELNPFEPPQSQEQPAQALAKRLGPFGTALVALLAISCGAIACGTSCTAIFWVGGMTGTAIGGYGNLTYLGLFAGFLVGAIVGSALLVFVTRYVFSRAIERHSS
ncbi:hypothetical protein Pla175_06830 [Pirellulimonas nuda]|uniref:Uncharacterized protein n=1 Tax=Pirellulimonas nuda TaxID=2528009 RepID=A0A518D764_9BACT|nr:hypothetical protein [Pirellulimonas nuda]QDU87324.1 hypothetical protein Pla175_06830 [Pirellulimonas nuda]